MAKEEHAAEEPLDEVLEEGALAARLLQSDRVFVLGVMGDSGSGKTTLTEGIRKILGADLVSGFSLDDYHRYDRKQRKERQITALHPDANDMELLADHLEDLKVGKSIEKPYYDHDDGTLKGPFTFVPTPVVIIEGLLGFTTERLRDLIDLKVYIDPAREVKRAWKLRRDVKDRGHDRAAVMRAIEKREADYKRHIEWQKIWSDVVIKIRFTRFRHEVADGPEMLSVHMIQTRPEARLETLSLPIHLTSMLTQSLQPFRIQFDQDIYYDKEVSLLTIDGRVHRDVIFPLIDTIHQHTGTPMVGMFDDPSRHVNAVGVMQLILAWRFMETIEAGLDARSPPPPGAPPRP